MSASRFLAVTLLLTIGCASPGPEATPSNEAPVAVLNASRATGAAPLVVTFDASGSTDPDGAVASYAWDLGDGRSDEGAQVTNSYPLPGEYTIALTVTDDRGAVGSSSFVLRVTAPEGNQAPQAAISAAPLSGPAPLTVSFDGSGSSDSDGTIAAFQWSFGDGEVASGPTATHTYASGGNFQAELLVTDDDGAEHRVQVTIQVSSGGNLFPLAVVSATPSSGAAPLEVAFNGAGSSDPDGSVVSHRWDFGDGQTATGASTRHTYTSAGSYTATLTVTDDDGGESSATTRIQVVNAAGGGIVVDHLAVDKFTAIPARFLGPSGPAAAIRQAHIHASVGSQMTLGLDCLQGTRTSPAELCGPFGGANQYKYDRRNWSWIGHTSGGWTGKIDDLVNLARSAQAANYDVLSQKHCYLEAIDGLQPCVGAAQQEAAWNYLRTQMESLERDFPGKRFIWWTVPLTQQVGNNCMEYFNSQIRSYALANGKILFDLADVMSHDPSGVKTVDAQGREISYRPYCGEQTPTAQACHPNWDAKVRLAKAFWVLMARMAGWDGVSP